MECCGQDRTSKFCPDCGTLLMDTCLAALLDHIRRHALQHGERVELYAKGIATGHSMAKKYERWLPAKRTLANKWQAWADELEKAIAALAEKGEP